MRNKAKSSLLGRSNWCVVSDGSEITAAGYSHSSAMKGDWKFLFTCLLFASLLWLHDRNWGARGGCSGTVLRHLPLAQENPELEEFSSSVCPVSSCSIALQNVSGRKLMERRKKRLPYFPFSVWPPAARGETCRWLLPEVPVPCEVRGGSVGVNSGLGWLLILAEGLDQELPWCVMSCQGRCWFGRLLPFPVGLGTLMSTLSGGCLTCEALIHHPFVRQPLYPAVWKQCHFTTGRIHLMEFCSLVGSQALAGCRGASFRLYVLGEKHPQLAVAVCCCPSPGCSVSGQVVEVAADHRMPGAGCSVRLQRHSGSGGGAGRTEKLSFGQK